MNSRDAIIEGLEEFPEQAYEMANVHHSRSKLPYDVWLDPKGKERNVKHNLTGVKVHTGGKTYIPVSVPMSDSEEPRILVNGKIGKFKVIAEWIKANRETIIKHWNGELDDFGALAILYGVDIDK